MMIVDIELKGGIAIANSLDEPTVGVEPTLSAHVDKDPAAHGIQVEQGGIVKNKPVLVEGQKFPHRLADVDGEGHEGAGIKPAGGDQRRECIEIGAVMGGDELHTRRMKRDA
jgi:hypothetical protein